MRRRHPWLAGWLAAAVLGGCSGGQPPVDEPAAHKAHPGGSAATDETPASAGPEGMSVVEVPYERRQLMGVRTAEVTRRPLTMHLRSSGIVVADERRVRTVQTKISGWVDQLFVSFTGAYVKAGDPILSIYSPELVATQREYLLALRSRAEEAGGRKLLESARDRLRYWDVTESQIEALARTGQPHRSVALHSPIGGYVTVKPVYQGMYVTPEMELYRVSDLSTVWVLGDLYEIESGLVAVGQSATISLSSEPDRRREASVSWVSPTVELRTRTVRVRFDIENRDGALKPGMYATVELAAPLGEILAVPEEAVIDTGRRRVVFVEVAPGRFQPREVEVGRGAEGHYQVHRGLAEGDRVAVSAQFLLDSESRLRAVAAAPAHSH